MRFEHIMRKLVLIFLLSLFVRYELNVMKRFEIETLQLFKRT